MTVRVVVIWAAVALVVFAAVWAVAVASSAQLPRGDAGRGRHRGRRDRGAPRRVVAALHVLYPTGDGETAHLLLTANRYLTAASPAEVELLTKALGPAAATVDPAELPPASTMSVAEALAQLSPCV
ncbi:MAG: hypothetical protein ACRDYA_17670 [Egibacteraceae bacterium]